ncbi:hypothetical protein BCR42DRAFT_438824 [Absidia repens]|uniref:Uncharacterized protein n=1 Tax=Absidia repens TaxID=90262 RepID=A0A1X2IFG3_9FUNG|nr:hypothetical protein BCR42DRAFT_438824 [Absidia repens]
MSIPLLKTIDSRNAPVEALKKNRTNYDGLFQENHSSHFPNDQRPYSRVLIAPIGTISSDIDDARRFKDTAFQAGKHTLQADLMAPTDYLAFRSLH